MAKKKPRLPPLPGYPVKKIFQTVEELDAYFDQDCLPCLLCGRSYRTLHTHLLKTHHMAADDYRARYGIPWTRGLLTKSLGDIYAVHT
jgi:predicted transcriptional regulator